MKDIKLGDKVKDMVTGYTGIAVARTEFLNGCIQYTVARKLKKGESMNLDGDPSIDERVLEVVKRKVILSREYEDEGETDDTEIPSKHKSEPPGGPTRITRRMRGY